MLWVLTSSFSESRLTGKGRYVTGTIPARPWQGALCFNRKVRVDGAKNGPAERWEY